MQPELVLTIAVLVYSVVLHEAAHGYMANFLGDPTARLMGRLTLNPLKHIDPFGSVLLPGVLAFTQAPFLFGWAKPVPYNPYNLRRGGAWAEALVAAAGPGSNFLLAAIFAVVVRVASAADLPTFVSEASFIIVYINVMLGCFNLLPLPPLDGSKVLSMLLPHHVRIGWERLREQMEHNLFLGFGALMIFVLLFGGLFGSLVFAVARTLAGV